MGSRAPHITVPHGSETVRPSPRPIRRHQPVAAKGMGLAYTHLGFLYFGIASPWQPLNPPQETSEAKKGD